jgi:hypothetical protein
MRSSQCHVGQRVRFGRPNGQQTVGTVIKKNPAKAKVQLEEARGTGRGSPAGSIWLVPYAMMSPADGDVADAVADALPPLQFSQSCGGADEHILSAICHCYGDLSPENLSGDGELSAARIRQRRAEIERRLQGLFQAFGRSISEEEIYAWQEQRRQHAIASRSRT